MSKQTTSIEDVIAGDLAEWRGLPDRVELASVLAALAPLNDVGEPREAVRTYRRCWHSGIRRTVPPKLLEIWEGWDHSSVFLIEYDDPPISNLDTTLERLGPPELVLKGKRIAIGLTLQEHVYAGRGLTLSIGEPYPTSTEERRRCTHLQLYRGGSLQLYLTEIGTGPEPSPHPL